MPPEAAHTHGRFGYSSPRQQQSTKEAPTPISGRGAETKLKATMHSLIAAIRTLQDYKHRVFGEASDICTDCGASPQDARHLFACNVHPTDFVTRGSMPESGGTNSYVQLPRQQEP